MSEELLVSRIKAALDVAPADPALRARVIQSLPLNRRLSPAPRWLAPAIAALLAIAVVAGLIWANPFATVPGRSLPLVPLGVCQLPVWGFGPYDASSPSAYQVGFLDVSTGTFTAAPSTISIPSQPQRNQLDLFAPAISYDRAAGAFVPVPSSWIAPGGMSYVYSSGSDIHIRYLPSQSDRVLFSGKSLSPVSISSQDSGPYLLGWSGGLIYYATRRQEASALWAIDPATGTSHQVAPMQSGSEWWVVGPDAIWGSTYYTMKIARYDTKTHAVSSWSLDGLVEIIGVDSSGNPIILLGDFMADSGQIAIMHGNGNASLLDSKSDIFKQTHPIVVPDGDRIWFSATGQRLWVYSPDTGLLFLDQRSNRSLPNGLVVAGGCVSKVEVSPEAP